MKFHYENHLMETFGRLYNVYKTRKLINSDSMATRHLEEIWTS